MTPGSAAEAVREMGMAPGQVSVIANPPAISHGPPAVVPEGRYLLGVGQVVDHHVYAGPALARLDERIGDLLALLGPGVHRHADLVARARPADQRAQPAKQDGLVLDPAAGVVEADLIAPARSATSSGGMGVCGRGRGEDAQKDPE